MTNGIAHHYHLGESTFILEASGVIFFSKQTVWPKMETPRHIWGYTVCLCPMKRMPGLYELIVAL